MGLHVCMSVCWDWTDVTLAYEHTNSIPTGEVNDFQEKSVHYINMDKLEVLARFLVPTSSWRHFRLTLALWLCDLVTFRQPILKPCWPEITFECLQISDLCVHPIQRGFCFKSLECLPERKSLNISHPLLPIWPLSWPFPFGKIILKALLTSEPVQCSVWSQIFGRGRAQL